MSGNAGFGSDGNPVVNGDVIAEVIATGDAIATVSSNRLSISGVRVAVNEVTADFNAEQSAYAFGNGSASVLGNVTIRTLLNDANGGEPSHGAHATVRGPAGSINLISADTNNAYANATSTNDAYIENINLTAAVVTLLAETYNFANAEAINGSTVSLTAFGDLYAESHASDSASVVIRSATVDVYKRQTQDDVIDMEVRDVTGSVNVDTGKGDDRVNVRVEKKPNLEFGIDMQEGWQTAFEGITSIASIQELPEGLQQTMRDLLSNINGMVIDLSLIQI